MLQEEEWDFRQHSHSSSMGVGGVAASRSRQGTQLAPRLLEGPQAAAQRRQLRNEAVLPQATTGRTKPSLQVCWWVEKKFYLAQG